MTNYEKLVETLRWTANEYKGSIMDEYDKDTMNAAADAIEALQADLQAEKKKTVAQIYYEEQMAWEGRCKDLMYWIADLQAQLPKRGEWIATKYYTWECSVCGKNPTTGMGYVQTRKALYNYCPNCGAKMEVPE